MSRFVSAIILALGLASVGVFVGNSIKYFKNFDRYVEVKGLAEETVKSDQAIWQIGFSASNNDLKQIYSTINNEQQTIMSFLLVHGFTANQIQKQPASVIDNYANSYSNNTKTSRYTATSGIVISSYDVDKVAQVIQMASELVESGVILTNNNVAYSYNKLNDIKTGMLNDALTNAKKSAEEFAAKSQSQLGAIRNASQGLFSIASPGGNGNDNASIEKKVRVVTTVQFFLK